MIEIDKELNELIRFTLRNHDYTEEEIKKIIGGEEKQDERNKMD